MKFEVPKALYPFEHRFADLGRGVEILRDITLVMQDWGGPVGLGLAGRRPELVKRLVIGNTWAWPLVGERRMEVFSWVMGGPLGRAAAYLFNGPARFFFKDGLVRRPDKDVLAMYLAPFRRRRDRKQTSVSPRLLIKAATYLEEVEAGLVALRDRPALLPWGTKDFAFRDAERERFERLFPNHRTLPLEASHFWQEDAGEEAAEAIRDWMA